MWRLANCIYRAFRNVATHRCPQDIVVPLANVCNKDDDDSDKNKQETKSVQCLFDFHRIIKNGEFTSLNFEKIKENLHQISRQQLTEKQQDNKSLVKEVSPPTISPTQNEETLDSLLQSDESTMNTLKRLTDLNEETMSIINNQLAIEALENGNLQMGIEILQDSAKTGKNAAALYNLGICYERGIGVEQDRAKACDYYRQASILGHINAQFNLTLLSNNIDINDNEDEIVEQTIVKKPHRKLNISFTKEYKEERQGWNDQQLNLTKTLACLP